MGVDWSRLDHAYGPATDTPGHLHALELGDAEAHGKALEHIDVAVLHQGFPETATAPVVRAVTELLAGRRAHPETIGQLVEFLGDVARSVTGLAGHEYFVDLADLADAVAAAYPVVLPLFETFPLDHLPFRAASLVEIAQLPSLAEERARLAALIVEWSGRDPGPQERWVHCLGELGVDLRGRLTDPDPAVRLRAAMFHEDDPRGHELIRGALAGPLPRGLYQGEVVAAAIRTASSFDTIATEACGLVTHDSWAGFDTGWGALVAFAFAEPYDHRKALTNAQRALLRALAANDDQEIWNLKNGNCSLVFRDAGLPHSRGACRRLAEDLPGDRSH